MKIADRITVDIEWNYENYFVFLLEVLESVRNVAIYYLSYNCVQHTSTPMFRPPPPTTSVGHFAFVFQKHMVARRQFQTDPITVGRRRPARRSDTMCDFHLYPYGDLFVRESQPNNRRRVSLRSVCNVSFSILLPPRDHRRAQGVCGRIPQTRTFVPDIPKKNLNRNNISS